MAPDVTRRNAYIAWVVVCFVWGTTFLAIRIALESIPPALIGGIRYTIAGGVMAIVFKARGMSLPERGHWPGLVLLGFLMIAIGNGFVIWAEQWVASGIAAVVLASSPFWMSAVDALARDGEPLRRGTVIGLGVGFGGILVLVWPALLGSGEWGPNFAVGVVALQLACVGWSLGSAYGKRHARQDNALAASAMQMLFGGITMLVIGTLRGEWANLAFTPRTMAAELYLIVFGSICGYSAYVYALKYLPVSTVSLYAYINPVIAVILGTILLGEPFTARVLLAGTLVFAGVAIVRLQMPQRSPHTKGLTSVRRLFAR